MDEDKGRAVGGKAAAAKMTKEERLARAQKGVEARRRSAEIPTATHIGEIKIGDTALPCAVLPGGARVLSQGGVISAFGPVTGGWQSRQRSAEDDSGGLPTFLVAKSLKPFISEGLRTLVTNPKMYKDPRGGPVRVGLDATLIPQVCEVWLKARDAGKLTKIQKPVAARAEMLMRGLAHIGIIALVDEATGFQRDRERDALAKILEAFVAKELQPYVKTFPADFYEQLFRLYGLTYPPIGNKSWRPSFFGHITNEVVYARLAPELLPELKKAASKAEKRAKLHQWLTQEIGHPKLREHLASLIAIQKLSATPEQFMQYVDRVHPRFMTTRQLPFPEHDALSKED